ncbi:MAG: TIGR03016 family PEP-CTERM system-associated outer membrane protein [Comamonadaceae bacterium]|nr:MAG: TIGR03016 family PEP-CTERM system-associated outer membrane protein [Comamonadaceae bacterium]
MRKTREVIVKIHKLRAQAPGRPALRAVALACFAVLSAPAWAQVAEQSEVRDGSVNAEGGPRRTVLISPAISTGVLITNNGTQTPTPRSEQILEVSPGVRAIINSARAKGFFDYSLSAQYRLQGTSGDYLRNQLNTAMTFEALGDRVFVDVSGVVGDETVSAFNTQALRPVDANRSRTTNFRVSPYVRGTFGNANTYELRYGLERATTSTDERSDVNVQDISLSMASDMTGRRFGWSLFALTQETEYSLSRNTRSDQVLAGLNYAATPQLLLTLQAGTESNDVLTANRESYSITGLNADWRPSNRTRMVAGVQRRYFGNGHNVLFEHRTAATVWRYSDTRDAVNNPLDSGATLGSVYSQLENFYAGEPDPVIRAQLIQEALLARGLPADAAAFNTVLTSSATLVRAQQLSLALLGPRDAITFLLLRTTSSRLGPAPTLGDDFNLSQQIDQRSWSVNYSHRITPLTTYTLGMARLRNDGAVAGLSNRLNVFTTGLITRLGLRTTGAVQLQRSVYDQVGAPYSETAISANITHRF